MTRRLAVALILAGTLAWGQSPRLLRTPVSRLVALLPPPPAPDSVPALADLETVKQIQAWRSPEQAALAARVDAWDVWDFSEVLGPWFAKDGLPQTARFFKQVGDELAEVSLGAKKRFKRPRPPKVDAGLQPVIRVPASASYPSGHSLYLFMEAEVLADLFPELRARLLEYAHRAAWARVLGGVHFPSDIVAGRLLGQAFVAALRRNPAYAVQLETCRAEMAAARIGKAS